MSKTCVADGIQWVTLPNSSNTTHYSSLIFGQFIFVTHQNSTNRREEKTVMFEFEKLGNVAHSMSPA